VQPKNITTENALKSRSDLKLWVDELLDAVSPYFKKDASGIDLANFTAHYGKTAANIEAFSRLLWGVTPLLAAGQQPENFSFYIQAIKNGTNPAHPDYWGEAQASDQRIVEMAAYGVLLALAHQPLLAHFNQAEKDNLWRWLKQSENQAIPDNNWHYFPILVQAGFYQAGMTTHLPALERHFAAMEHYYLGDGWYADGPGRPRDYYVSMGFHFYGLIYSHVMADADPMRCAELRQRATLFAADFIYFFADDGAAIPFGRSMTYRFAQVAFWSAAAFTKLDVFSPGVVKGIILRHLRSWIKQPIYDRDGVLSVGYHYPNLIMAEDYNAPGSPYWALKAMLVLALDEQDDFWQAAELPLPERQTIHSIAPASQIVVHQANHLWMLTSGQLEFNNFVNTEAKYCKFAYSARYGFTLERGRYGLNHAAADSMLLLSEKDNYWRGRRECSGVKTADDMIYSRWLPWSDVVIDTWLVPLGCWQVRIHHINTARPLECAEGGFSLAHAADLQVEEKTALCQLTTPRDISALICLSSPPRQGEHLLTPPNSHLLFSERAAIPLLRGELNIGKHLLICAVWAGSPDDFDRQQCPQIIPDDHQVTLKTVNQQKQLSLIDLPETSL